MMKEFLAGEFIGGMQPIYESPLQVKNPYFIVGNESTLDLTTGAPSDTLTVRARVPARLVLKGPADLLFGEFNLIFTAQALTRDLNDTAYGIVRATSASAGYTEFRLPEPAYVERFLAEEGYNSASVYAREAGGYERLLAGSNRTFKCGLTVTGFRAKDFGSQSDVEILSPSSASQVVVALPDGTPLHSFPAVFDPEAAVEIATRDLTEALNKAWPINGGNLVLLVTSLTDGQLKVAARGKWARTAAAIRAPGADAGPELTASVHPFAPVEAEVPLGTGWKKAHLAVTVDATCEGGLATRLQPVSAGRRFQVRVSETLQVAQAFRLRAPASPDGALPALNVTGVWLCLPAVPTEAQELDLRLTKATGEQLPDTQPLAQWKAQLPADAAAYVDLGTEVWFRAPCPKPVAIDGTLAAEPIFLVASGHGAGTLLVHRNLSAKLEPVKFGDLDNVPDAAPPVFAKDEPDRVLEGQTLVANLAVDRAWAPLSFNCYNALWRFELELAPDAPAAALVTLRLGPTDGAATDLPAGLTLEGAVFTWAPVTAPAVLKVQVQSRAQGSLTLRAYAEEVP